MIADSPFARRVFKGAGIYGLLVLVPLYLMETGLLPMSRVRLARPSDFYGFVGVALIWQLVFLLIASDPRRFRSLIPLAVLEKLVFGIPVLILYAVGRVTADVLTFGTIDLVLACLFFMSLRSVAVVGAR
jgi:hypothetical protein